MKLIDPDKNELERNEVSYIYLKWNAWTSFQFIKYFRKFSFYTRETWCLSWKFNLYMLRESRFH